MGAATYHVVEESGLWYIATGDVVMRDVEYLSRGFAADVAEKCTTISRLWHEVFAIELPLDKALASRDRPYGATCVNNGTDTAPRWILTEPYSDQANMPRVVTPSPTGYVQINVYDRDLYEYACAIIGCDPATDDQIKADTTHYDGYAMAVPKTDDARTIVVARLWNRRRVGIHIEAQNDVEDRFARLRKVGLTLPRYTRAQYIAACEVMGIEPKDDDAIPPITKTPDLIRDASGIALCAENVVTAVDCRRAVGIMKEQAEAMTGTGQG